MTDVQYDLLDELYFVISFTDLEERVELEREILLKEIHQLFEQGWVRVFKSPDDTMDYEKIDDQLLANSYLLASKQGLKAHNS